MRRLGMQEEDIQRLLAERGKSEEVKRQEQEALAAHKREVEQRQHALKQWCNLVDQLLDEEQKSRVQCYIEEEAAWQHEEPHWQVELSRAVRACREREMAKRLEEVRNRRKAELAAYEEKLAHLTPEEKEKQMKEWEEEEQRRMDAVVAAEEQRRRRELRRVRRAEARRRGEAEKAEEGTSDEGDDFFDQNELGKGKRGDVVDEATMYDMMEDVILNAVE